MDINHITGVRTVSVPVKVQDDALRFFGLTDGHE